MPSADESILAAALRTFESQKKLAEGAIEQLSDEQLRTALHPETNSVAVIMKHMAGNMLSRFTDFLTSDGEKPSRNRDREFIDDFTSRADVMDYWRRGWQCVFDELGRLSDEDLLRTVTIRGQPHSVALAINRQIGHYGYHVGQIVLTARILVGDDWNTLTIPRGTSADYNQRVWGSESWS